MKRVLSLDCAVCYQRLEAQPGALVTEHAARFDMEAEARTFAEFLRYFERRGPGEVTVPILRFRDASLEEAVQRTSEQVGALAWKSRVASQRVAISGRTRLLNTAPSTLRCKLAEWLGPHNVPARVAQEEVTVVRSVSGATVVCAPAVSRGRFTDPTLEQGKNGQVLLAALTVFAQPTPVAAAVAQLGARVKLDPRSAREVIEHLVDGRFLQPA